MLEKRKENRLPIIKIIAYSDDRHSSSEMVAMTTVDISSSGASMYTMRNFTPGVIITVCSPVFGNKHINARICWSSQVYEGIYRVGIVFH
ncbi:MAG: PilZ domain-containing protein [candidate division Zixibacteria bacterium]|nr:PilZ domain-containing protein [candidate division Zixibacteria bacterium]NIR66513.1 PilZ domain-containing protein [candidate division Zixibacteria bacterium]NIS48083.1 PilZ domain-containing protein [candidate division Zixibacteria bacterium]NIT54495.1 PilZ domain-containing protein [candidate division Zixibacteria bacterium]NIU16201.1 PilZ domain-containing protein [candidate division Zixibacteria bacterium]